MAPDIVYDPTNLHVLDQVLTSYYEVQSTLMETWKPLIFNCRFLPVDKMFPLSRSMNVRKIFELCYYLNDINLRWRLIQRANLWKKIGNKTEERKTELRKKFKRQFSSSLQKELQMFKYHVIKLQVVFFLNSIISFLKPIIYEYTQLLIQNHHKSSHLHSPYQYQTLLKAIYLINSYQYL